MPTRAALLFCLALTPGLAHAGVCEAAATAAEPAFGLPAGLLGAIGRMETGRPGPGGTQAWPWSVNAAGQGYFLPSADAAIALVGSLQARGLRSIDVGCFQVNLLHHPDAFASLAAAFDPGANAAAAGAFLRDLRRATADWPDAVGRYHSATAALGLPYMRQVYASWAGGPAMAAPPTSQVAALVQVYGPPGAVPQPVAHTGPRLPMVPKLPMVIVPSRL